MHVLWKKNKNLEIIFLFFNTNGKIRYINYILCTFYGKKIRNNPSVFNKISVAILFYFIRGVS